MITGALLFALTSAAYLFAPPFWPFLVVRIFQGIGFAFFQTASLTLIVNISSEAHRGRSVSYFYLAINLSGALGPSIGMFLINHFTFPVLFWVCVGLSLGSLFIAHRLGWRQFAPLPNSSKEDRFLLSRKAVSPSIISSLSLFIWGALTGFFPLYAVDQGISNPGLFLLPWPLCLFWVVLWVGSYWISIAEKKSSCLALPLISFRWSSSLFPKRYPCLFLLR